MALDFTFSPEHEAWRTHVREFAERELRPHTRKWDEQGDLPHDAIRRMGEAGILGVIGARRLGGQETRLSEPRHCDRGDCSGRRQLCTDRMAAGHA